MNQKVWSGLLAGAAGVGLWIGSWLTASIILRAVLSAAAIACCVLAALVLLKPDRSTPSRDENAHWMDGERALKESFVQALSMRRHDYMNDIQLLMGYLQLKKFDKLKDFVEILKDRATQESHMFRWGIPDLIVHMYMFSALSRKLQVSIETEEHIQLHMLPLDSEYVAARIIELSQLFEQFAIVGQATNSLTIAVYEVNDEVCAIYEYEGSYDSEMLQRLADGFLDQHDLQLGTSVQWEEQEGWLEVSIRFPFADEERTSACDEVTDNDVCR